MVNDEHSQTVINKLQNIIKGKVVCTYVPLESEININMHLKGHAVLSTTCLQNKEIRICNDAGRLIRPVLKIRQNKTLITEDIIKRLKSDDIQWDDLLCDCKLEESIIEYIDPVELLGTRDQEYGINEYKNFVSNSMNEGVTLIGGCCEVKPRHIEALSSLF